MMACTLFPDLHLYPSDTTREHPTRVRIGGLRHKLRHKFPTVALVVDLL